MICSAVKYQNFYRNFIEVNTIHIIDINTFRYKFGVNFNFFSCFNINFCFSFFGFSGSKLLLLFCFVILTVVTSIRCIMWMGMSAWGANSKKQNATSRRVILPLNGWGVPKIIVKFHYDNLTRAFMSSQELKSSIIM